jgi:hypothetical protein
MIHVYLFIITYILRLENLCQLLVKVALLTKKDKFRTNFNNTK